MTGSVRLSCAVETTGGETFTEANAIIGGQPECVYQIEQGATSGFTTLDAGDYTLTMDTSDQDYLGDTESNFTSDVTCDFNAPVDIG